MEFRLRLRYAPSVVFPGGERYLNCSPVCREDIQRLLNYACASSPYTVQDTMNQGYIMAPGGVRIGLCGQVHYSEKGVPCMSELTSASVRIPRQVLNCGKSMIMHPVVSTLILSPPGGGKTTLLRDLIRLLSDEGYRIGVCDERGEIASYFNGDMGFDVGRCTDVITGLPKAKAAMTLLRSMNPQILAMDEITDPEDVSACETSANCGVCIFATAHAYSLEDLHRRAIYRPLIEREIFQRIICIQWSGGQRNYVEEKI